MHRNVKAEAAAVTLYDHWNGDFFGGYMGIAGKNAINLITGSRMQQACELRVEETVETAQNRKDGT